MRALSKQSNIIEEARSERTLESQFDVFIHTYVPTQSRKGKVLEDSLDCPLNELEMVQTIGETNIGEKRETVYAFRREEKHEISTELFAYCVYDYFLRKHPKEATLSFREISIGEASPGQVFKLPESDIRERLEGLKKSTNGILEFRESANLQQIHKKKSVPSKVLLKSIYKSEAIRA
jgi:hypothetical protein